MLIDAGVDLTAVDRYGKTCAHSPSYLGYAECLRMLIDAGVDLNAVDRDGKTCAFYASWEGMNTVTASTNVH